MMHWSDIEKIATELKDKKLDGEENDRVNILLIGNY